MQGQVGRGHALAETSAQMNPDHFRRKEINRLAEHAGFRFDTPHPPADDTEAVDHGGVGVRADQGVGIIKLAVADGLRENAFGQVFQIHLVHDADARGHHAESLECLLAPLEELVAFAVAAEFHLEIQLERFRTAEEIDLHRVIDDEINGHERLDHGRILARRGHGVAHRGQVDQQRHTGEVLQNDAGHDKRDFFRRGLPGLPGGEGADVFFADLATVAIAQDGFEDNADADRQTRHRTESGGFEARQRVKKSLAAGSGREFFQGGKRIVHEP